MEKQNRESHCVQGSGIFLVGAGDRQQPYLSPARCSTGMFLRWMRRRAPGAASDWFSSTITGKKTRNIYLLVEIYLAKQK